MRIGTWNLAGRWDVRHRRLLESMDCDVWLLTEVREGVALDGYAAQTTRSRMRRSVAWASVLGRSPMEPLADPHGASAAARVDGVVFCSSILPWRACGSGPPWSGDTHVVRTAAAVTAIMAALPLGPVVWGGDWNHALAGREYAGSVAARQRILSALEDRRLSVPTRDLADLRKALPSSARRLSPQLGRLPQSQVSTSSFGGAANLGRNRLRILGPSFPEVC